MSDSEKRLRDAEKDLAVLVRRVETTEADMKEVSQECARLRATMLEMSGMVKLVRFVVIVGGAVLTILQIAQLMK